MAEHPPPPAPAGWFRRFLRKAVYPYGKQTGGAALLKKELKAASKGIVRAAVAPGFETASERRLREYRNLILRGYSAESAMRISGVTAKDLENF